MSPVSYAPFILVLSVFASGCTPPAGASSPEGDESVTSIQGGGAPREHTALSTVEELAQKVSGSWDADKAKTEEAMLSLKVRVDHKSALVVAGSEVKVVLGAEAATSAADITVDVPYDNAREIVEGKATFKGSIDAFTVDNQQGLERFLRFVKD